MKVVSGAAAGEKEDPSSGRSNRCGDSELKRRGKQGCRTPAKRTERQSAGKVQDGRTKKLKERDGPADDKGERTRQRNIAWGENRHRGAFREGSYFKKNWKGCKELKTQFGG